MGKGGYYAVARGRQVGIFGTWDECKAQVTGFPNARFKKFGSSSEAESFIQENRENKIPSSVKATTSPNRTQPVVHSPSNVPKNSYTVPNTAAAASKFEFPAPSRLQHRSAVLISPLPRTENTATSTASAGTKRSFHTSSTLDKRGLRVTEDRVTGVKRLKTEANAGVDLTKFQVDEEGYVIVYTDGACTANGKRGAKAGVGVFFGDRNELNVSEPVFGRQTNNTAEIQAAEKAIIQAKSAGITKLKLLTDSQFTINCITTWIKKWKRNGWKLGNGSDVKNREDLEKLETSMSGIEIKWSYVRGHRGIYGNEQADQLAVAGANMSRK